jgi:hypothetical protein
MSTWPTSEVTFCQKLIKTQCLQRDRFVTQLCLLFWLGGTLMLLACP